jgi:TorA maturation chaperone TorD
MSVDQYLNKTLDSEELFLLENDSERTHELENMIQASSFLSALFLALPDEAFISGLLKSDFGDTSGNRGLAEISAYVTRSQGLPVSEVLLEVGRDRARLVRGVGNNSIDPPYESIYTGRPQNTTILDLKAFYSELGFEVSESIKDAVDQIGIELAFVKELATKELDAYRTGQLEAAESLKNLRNKFMNTHLDKWRFKYAEAMKEAAATGFYRGVALLILDL